MQNKTHNIILFLLFALNLNAQTAFELAELLDLSPTQIEEQLPTIGYTLITKYKNEVGIFLETTNETEKIYFGFANSTMDSLTSIDLQTKNKEKAKSFLRELKNNVGLKMKRGNVERASAFIFNDEHSLEFYLIYNSYIDLYTLGISNYEMYAQTKEHLETQLEYKTRDDVLYQFRQIAMYINSAGKMIEDELTENLDIQVEWENDLDNFLTKYKGTKAHKKMQQIVKEKFLSDQHFMDSTRKRLFTIQLISYRNLDDNFMMDEQLLNLLVDNELFRTLLIMDYLCGDFFGK